MNKMLEAEIGETWNSNVKMVAKEQETNLLWEKKRRHQEPNSQEIIWCQESNLCWLHTRQVPYSLHYCSGFRRDSLDLKYHKYFNSGTPK